MRPTASVIVRTWNRAATIERTLWSLRHQSVPLEIVVVDSGSTDATLDVAEPYADHVVELASADFSYGRALNRGAAIASGDVHFTLSSHCAPQRSTWVEESLRHYGNDRVAATNGATHTPDGRPLHASYHQEEADIVRNPLWGYSNHAGSWRARVWQGEPFREDLVACEDKEWSWRVLAEGLTIAFDPALVVPADHRRLAGARSLWRRVRRECEVLAELGVLPAPDHRALLHRWWSEPTLGSRYPLAVQRMSPHRALELHAAFVGARPPARGRSRPRAAPDHGDQQDAPRLTPS